VTANCGLELQIPTINKDRDRFNLPVVRTSMSLATGNEGLWYCPSLKSLRKLCVLCVSAVPIKAEQNIDRRIAEYGEVTQSKFKLGKFDAFS